MAALGGNGTWHLEAAPGPLARVNAAIAGSHTLTRESQELIRVYYSQ